ncbi:hypothetical protein NLC36_05165 [Candidatus Aminicenantes bacterium AC-335-L06]|nr:hypothetical protein [Candidatus Aminicenantes bacterium AC-335-L06]
MEKKFKWGENVRFLERDDRIIIVNLGTKEFVKIKKEALKYLKKSNGNWSKKCLKRN